MKYLLPHRFKKFGALMAPIGFAAWVAMQLGFVERLLIFLSGFEANIDSPNLHLVNVCVAVISFFSFLAGMYFLSFSKEKVEDEMVQRIRLDSFQFAAFAQIVLIIAGFLLMIIFEEPGEGGLMLFFITIIILFWLSFIFRFNYTLRTRNNEAG